MALTSDTTLRLTILATALAAITLEDLTAIQEEGQLGPDVVANIAKLKADSSTFDDQALAALQAQAQSDGLPTNPTPTSNAVATGGTTVPPVNPDVKTT